MPPNGGDYWRQAVFYKILIDQRPYQRLGGDCTIFDFVEPVSEGEYYKEKFVITPIKTV
jgi:DNA helicase-2/ATP-dependent DNA helicase PcrA